MSAAWSQPPRDDLAPARGILLGLCIGALLWLLIIGGLLYLIGLL